MSAPADKAGQAAALASSNFERVMETLYANRHKQFANSKELRQFVEQQAAEMSKGLVEEGVLFRTGADSRRSPYTRVKDLPRAMDQFYEELFTRLKDQRQEPKELAAWIEYRMDLTDHFFAEGCGRTAKAISAWALMRKGEPLPAYGSREAYFDLRKPEGQRRLPAFVRDVDTPTSADAQFMRWYAKYMEFFPAQAVE